MAELENVAEFDQDYQDLSDKTMDAYYLLEEVSTKLSTAIEGIEFNPTELLQIEERILILNTLRKKYGPELSDVLKTLEKIQLELSDLMGGTENSESLEEALKEAQAESRIASEHLNTARHAIAKELETDIKKELADLYMEKADFSVQFESGKFSSKGHEQVEFYIQTNPGEGF